ncbi:beta-glucosidase 11-like isoform X2 [Actinidia eriantha]|uniref:beta-glucosidase 11-like isoform X2 n=1 Tax=Actinidia eriantha TaxID=165200 RepID=UPI002582DC55|nr:beta-glucosidase 11-like isoform X2 [Actinidia eriantha]
MTSLLTLSLVQVPLLTRLRERHLKMEELQPFGTPLLMLEDIQLMVETGLEAYRFSISWSRLIPNGRGPVNPKGLEFYNNFINELMRHGIQPHVTLVHDDLPQALEDEYEGWLSRNVVKDFTVYADVCFRNFGDRVLHWTTFNEVNIFALGGYDLGKTPPQRCSPPFGTNCSKGNSSSEPYIAAHNILLAHASAANLYKNKYQGRQQGFIGINIYTYWYIPYTNATEDVIATQRAKDFYVGWIINPVVFGDYPEIMKKNAGIRIPAFTELESKQVKGSFDFIGVDHYGTYHVKDDTNGLKMDNRDVMADLAIQTILVEQGDTPPGELPITPSGLVGLLEYFQQFYGNPPIYIHENGQRTYRNTTLQDIGRVKHMHGYIGGLLDAVRNGSNARGYFVWSFLDLFELLFGFEEGYGLYYVDLDDKDLKRYPKLSAHWYSNFLKGGNISLDMVETISSLSQSHLSE